MTKKVIALSEYIPAEKAAQLLSERLNRVISARYIRKLSQRKKNPVQCVQMGTRWLYLQADIEETNVRARRDISGNIAEKEQYES